MNNESVRPRTIAIAVCIEFAVILLCWVGVSQLVFIVPSPAATMHGLWRVIVTAAFSDAAWRTAQNIVFAFVPAVIVGIVAGVFTGLNDNWYRAVTPVLITVAAVPKLVFYPIFLLLFGLGPGSVIAMGFLAGVFPTFLNCASGVRSLNPVYLRLGKSLRLGKIKTLYYIILPATTTTLVSGCRLGLGLCVMNTIIAEAVATKVGLGKLIIFFYGVGQFEQMLGLIMLVFFAAMAIAIGLWAVEQRAAN